MSGSNPRSPREALLAELLDDWSRLRTGDHATALEALQARAGDLWPDLMEIVEMDDAMGRITGTAATALGRTFGRFEILAKLGAGAYGTVYRVRDTASKGNVECALKVLSGVGYMDEEILRRFQEEGRSRVTHPNVVQILDAGVIEGRPFLALELLEGGTLESLLDDLRALGAPCDERWNRLLDERGVRPAPSRIRNEGERFARRIAGLFGPLYGALAALDEAGVVHRDIKPQNLLFTSQGTLKMADFGIARQEYRTRLTETVATIGTLPYMSPEQAAGGSRDVTVASDVHALGATLYEALTLQPPFEGRTISEVLGAILHRRPTPVREFAPQIPEDLELVVARCLEKAPPDRPGEPKNVEYALESIAAGRAGPIRPIPWGRRLGRFAGRHMVAMGVAVGLVLATIAALWIASVKPAHIDVKAMPPAAIVLNGSPVGMTPVAMDVAPGRHVVIARATERADLFEEQREEADLSPGNRWSLRLVLRWKDPESREAALVASASLIGRTVELPRQGHVQRQSVSRGVKIISPRGDVAAAGLVVLLEDVPEGSAWIVRIAEAFHPGVPLVELPVPADALADEWEVPGNQVGALPTGTLLRIDVRRPGVDVPAAWTLFQVTADSEFLAALDALPRSARSELHPRLLAAMAGLGDGRAAEAYLECRRLMREFPRNRLVLDTALEALDRLGLGDSMAYQDVSREVQR